ncbi:MULTISPECIES: SDR family NAD(P)-dependent oxidoreductase [Robiginitalea]|uniref:2-deoxy-D-gluconate 3-dehydrogenase n=1 Tax=Robiginitalea biformata (strain ATCC BAA-864 / DSM 15991 / KCTC 12146 / HTCC2501) TaxID=313596 RepID=A4CGS5_ROBBH|nr:MULTISPECIES: SDR family oxidoreductase [Robiginitalea]EAR16133.1 2-deoxy-D-gluconate 3-dehydrogenase [Robiginitalea biformata HTCC2501]MDC6353586.1 SDR family NAD(P)-dependent oxidoreductase [Robiginitalea sp. PM2]MDC6373249.1 SDR family NAD(P)-dependent oxidoreductase [Robiginitalea sp. SP8]
MKQKIVIVTGATSGLGYATAKKFCQAGHICYVLGRNPEKTRKTCKELGPQARELVLDLSRLEDIPGAVRQVQEAAGRIDVLVNNAGINMKKPLLEVSDAEFNQILQTNLHSVFSISREAGKVMKEQGQGNIVNISSMAAQYGLPYVVAYSASKTAIEGLTRAMAVELAPMGIRVNCVAPGFIKTPMTAKALDSDPPRKDRVFARTPMGEMGLPEDIADTVFYLASEEARFITGVVLPVDGGNSIGF